MCEERGGGGGGGGGGGVVDVCGWVHKCVGLCTCVVGECVCVCVCVVCVCGWVGGYMCACVHAVLCVRSGGCRCVWAGGVCV